MCDFGDSVEMINSQAKSVVGTMGYMAVHTLSLVIVLIDIYLCSRNEFKATAIAAHRMFGVWE